MQRFITPLVATATTVAGGQTVISPSTPIAFGLFTAGILAVCAASVVVGRKMSELNATGKQLEEGQRRFEKIESRLQNIELHCAKQGTCSKTQRISVDEG